VAIVQLYTDWNYLSFQFQSIIILRFPMGREPLLWRRSVEAHAEWPGNNHGFELANVTVQRWPCVQHRRLLES
jgi:hypothetical protein